MLGLGWEKAPPPRVFEAQKSPCQIRLNKYSNIWDKSKVLQKDINVEVIHKNKYITSKNLFQKLSYFYQVNLFLLSNSSIS